MKSYGKKQRLDGTTDLGGLTLKVFANDLPDDATVWVEIDDEGPFVCAEWIE